MSNIDIYEQLKEKREIFKKEMVEIGSVIVKDHAKSVFEKYPDVKFITWSQYTPYFNDGEPCEFTTHTPEFSFQSSISQLKEERQIGDPENSCVVEDYLYEINYHYYNTYDDGLGDEVRKSNEFKAFCSMVNDEDLMLQIFGDHIIVGVFLNENNEIQVVTCEEEDHG